MHIKSTKIVRFIKQSMMGRTMKSKLFGLNLQSNMTLNLMRKMDFERIGRNCFNPKAAKSISNHNLEVWPGFYSAMQKLESGPLIMLDLTNKVVRKDTVLSFIEELESANKSRETIQDEMKGKIVVTSYGQSKKTYRVDRIDFDRTPCSSFKNAEDQDVQFGRYYKDKYNVNIKNRTQPVLVSISERSGQEIVLIPEICEMTGLTDSQRANFNLMKDLSHILHKDANIRKNEAQELIKQLQNQEKIRKIINEWKIDFEQQPFQLEGQRITGGQVLMGQNASGQRSTFNIDCNPQDFDRNIQQEMFNQIPLKTWGIFFEQNNQKDADAFVRELQKCLEQFKYKADKPQLFCIQGRGYQAWENELKKKLNPSVSAIVLIAPGQKGKSPIYDQVKKLLIQNLPVPSQVILAQTISKGKNLRSIINKVVIQINAKIGGEPWALTDMPFLNQPTMIVGYDVHHKKKQKSLLAICATINQQANRYWSKVFEQKGEFEEIAKELEQVIIEAMEAFKTHNKIFPKQVVFYRDGVGESQKSLILTNEIDQIHSALNKLGVKDSCKFIFVMVNKRVKTKFMLDTNGRLENPKCGTVVDHSVTPSEYYDFFLVSQICRTGVATPSHYTVLYDGIKSKAEDIIKLTYRLCYLYYNYSGPVKIPAPVKYADKLAKMMGERGNIQPHNHYEKIKGLYYI
uniref:Otiwi3 n=1 Tax=Oxytricha trifallax TaxID=94289 RepID=H2DH96_OXYTR|nr:Otiwi3 [Sterkiella histriomuscorum]